MSALSATPQRLSQEHNDTRTHMQQGAFYVLPEMSAFFGPGAEAQGYGPVPDADALAMYLIRVAHVSRLCFACMCAHVCVCVCAVCACFRGACVCACWRMLCCPAVCLQGYGPVPDADALAACLIRVAHVSRLGVCASFQGCVACVCWAKFAVEHTGCTGAC